MYPSTNHANRSSSPAPRPPAPDAALAAAAQACERIAPTWPLDRFIAVNPLWGHVASPVPRVAAELAAQSGARMLMPRAWYRQQWEAGRFGIEHLRRAARAQRQPIPEQRLLAALAADEPTIVPRPRIVDLADAQELRDPAASWRGFVIDTISEVCASYFDRTQASARGCSDGGLYATWLRVARADRRPRSRMQLARYPELVDALPTSATELLPRALVELRVPQDLHVELLGGLLLDINGWASWCAYLRWTARLAGADDHHIVELLAIRLAWEWMLLRAGDDTRMRQWQAVLAAWPAAQIRARAAREIDWVLQRAIELAWSDDLARRLRTTTHGAVRAHPRVQAVFCIDVRSEVFRRALESVDDGVATLGFAGFFGLPVEYVALGSEHAQPQLPGLLAPRYRVTDVDAPQGLADARRDRLHAAQAYDGVRSGPASGFAFVEAFGLAYAPKLLAEAFAPHRQDDGGPRRAALTGAELTALAPRLTAWADGRELGLRDRIDLAERMLRAMSLVRGFAPLVVLVGHGASTRNNPHAAGLDCGACCGQTGEVNARAAAALLDEPEVRRGLAERGIEIPAATRFVAALHDTTTDDVELFATHAVTPSHDDAIARLRDGLRRAGVLARRERAARLGLADLSDDRLHAAMVARSRDWAEVRPEWGLAGNAGFVAARRDRTRGLDLAGRVFLHEYRWEDDTDLETLELIMTAPMVVAHWINFQYYMSTVDNDRHGSGNKTLHNVVGGTIGVFEGNGGDLRIGLPLQSLHDGRDWVHTPLRLTVVLEAPVAAIESVLARHERVRALIDNGWLHLQQLDPGSDVLRTRRCGAWVVDA